MRSALPKALHAVTGRPMIAHVLAAAREAGAGRVVVVLGHEAAVVRAVLPPDALSVVQEPQLGTGHAVRVALDALPDLPDRDALPDSRDGEGQRPASADTPRPSGDAGGARALILYGDMPLVTAATLRTLLDAQARDGRPLVLLSAVAPDPFGYGRVLRDAEGRVVGVREQKELSPVEEGVDEVNCGVYCADLSWLRRAVRALAPHPDGEYYLPDLVSAALADGGVDVVRLSAAPGAGLEEWQGVNTRAQLAVAERAMRARINDEHMRAGVTIVDPATTYIEPGVAVGQDTVIHPNTHLRGATTIGRDCAIGPDADVSDSAIKRGARVVRSVVEGARVGDECVVGPYAHLRHGAVLERGAHIGNYAEVKNSTIGPGSVSHHVSYIGDTTIGARVNIGAGTVTVNYDGARKYRTVIGDGAFIGSGTMLRAPVTIGPGGGTGAGSVVLRDVAPGVTVAGVPARPLDRRQAGPDEHKP